MTRSVGKGPFNEVKLKNTLITKIWSRRSVILPYCLNNNFLIYNGKIFIKMKITEEMIGHKFGEFAKTRKRPIHKSKRK
jgi:small subunit ribosomal protein S19